MITIEPYSDHHREDLIDLILSIQRNEFQIPITLADQPDLLEVQRFYKKFWVARADSAVVGSIGLLDIENREGALRKMFVHNDYRGKASGIAQGLLDTLLSWSRKEGLTAIYLGTTEKFKAAHRFYEKNGFVEVDVKSLPPSFPVMKVDVKFYRYDLQGLLP